VEWKWGSSLVLLLPFSPKHSFNKLVRIMAQASFCGSAVVSVEHTPPLTTSFSLPSLPQHPPEPLSQCGFSSHRKKSAADRPLDGWPLFRRYCQWEEHCHQIMITCRQINARVCPLIDVVHENSNYSLWLCCVIVVLTPLGAYPWHFFENGATGNWVQPQFTT
jgi:hypothetical protein